MLYENKLEKLVVDDTSYETVLNVKYKSRKKYTPYDPKKIYALIPGVIKEVFIKKGDFVNKNDKIFLLEAMKMYNTVTSPIEGKVKNIAVVKGKMVAKGDLLMEFE